MRRIFHLSESSLDKIIWRDRDKIFDSNILFNRIDKSNLIPYKIYSDLYDLYGKDLKPFCYMVNGKPHRPEGYEIDQKFYSKKLKILMKNRKGSNEIRNDKDLIVEDFLDNHFYKTGLFHEKMRMYCEFMDTYGGDPYISEKIFYKIEDLDFRNFYDCFGTSGCSAREYLRGKLQDDFYGKTKDEMLSQIIMNRFKIGDRYSKRDLKIKLQEIYKSLELNKTAKATDLKNYFKLSKTSITNQDSGEIENGFKLGSLYS